jgi:hypothetical protein
MYLPSLWSSRLAHRRCTKNLTRKIKFFHFFTGIVLKWWHHLKVREGYCEVWYKNTFQFEKYTYIWSFFKQRSFLLRQHNLRGNSNTLWVLINSQMKSSSPPRIKWVREFSFILCFIFLSQLLIQRATESKFQRVDSLSTKSTTIIFFLFRAKAPSFAIGHLVIREEALVGLKSCDWLTSLSSYIGSFHTSKYPP